MDGNSRMIDTGILPDRLASFPRIKRGGFEHQDCFFSSKVILLELNPVTLKGMPDDVTNAYV